MKLLNVVPPVNSIVKFNPLKIRIDIAVTIHIDDNIPVIKEWLKKLIDKVCLNNFITSYYMLSFLIFI